MTLTSSGPACRVDAGDHGAVAVVGRALDRLLVVRQVGAGAADLTHGVGAGVHGLLAGRPAVADVFASVSVVPSIWRSNRPGSVVGLEVLDDLERAGLPGVGDRADDVWPVVTGRSAGRRCRRWSTPTAPVPLSCLADDRLLVVGQVGAGAGRLADGVGAGVQGLLTGRARVAPFVGVGVRGAVDLEVERRGRSSGSRSLLTSSLPVSRVLVIVQTMSEPVVTRHVQRPGVVAGRAATTVPVPLSSLHRSTCRSRPGRAGAGGLAHGVVAGVQGLLAGRAAVADVVGVGSVVPSICRSNRPGSVSGSGP